MMKGLRTCSVCGRDFPLIEEEHYVARNGEKRGLTSIVNMEEPTLYDSFDCPHCGCQNIIEERKYNYYPTILTEKTEDHDGCSGCKYEGLSNKVMPCNQCKQNYMDYYKEGDDE